MLPVAEGCQPSLWVTLQSVPAQPVRLGGICCFPFCPPLAQVFFCGLVCWGFISLSLEISKLILVQRSDIFFSGL